MKALKFLGLFLLSIIALAAILAAIAIWFAQRPHEFEERIHLALPEQIGGLAPVWAAVTFELDVFDLAVAAEATLSFEEADLDLVLPGREFSMLVAETDSPTVASMLGRMEFESGGNELSGDGSQIEVSAALAGEFYVRERRDYAADEEQPDAGAQMPFAGKVTAVVDKVGLDEKWQLHIGGRSVRFALDDATRSNWRGRFGEGDHLADLVEGIVEQRANALFERLEADSSQLQGQLDELLRRRIESEDPELLDMLRLANLEVDDCPVVRDNRLSFSFSGEAHIELQGADGEFAVPDLIVRDGPCG